MLISVLRERDSKSDLQKTNDERKIGKTDGAR